MIFSLVAFFWVAMVGWDDASQSHSIKSVWSPVGPVGLILVILMMMVMVMVVMVMLVMVVMAMWIVGVGDGGAKEFLLLPGTSMCLAP